MLDGGMKKDSSWREHGLRIVRTAGIASDVTAASHGPQMMWFCSPALLRRINIHTRVAQTPLVSFELSGMGSIMGPRFPFSPGWFVPFSIPTFEMPESEATCIWC